MKSHALIFDCDGTMMDSLEAAVESFNYALQQMGERPRPPEEIKRYFGVAADRILMQLLDDESLGRRAYEIYKSYQVELALKTKVHPGIRELLDRAQQAGVRLAIVTGRHAVDLEILLRPHGLSAYFMAVVTDNQLSQPKPSPEGLLLAASQIGVPATRIFYVGDSVADIEAAQAAGAMAIAALWDSHVNIEEMTAAKPDYLAHQPDDVWTAFLKATESQDERPG